MPYRPPAPIARALIAERFQIADVIANAVDFSFEAAFHALHTRVGEVEKLIYFFMEGLPVIEDGLNRCLRAHGVEVVISGIFCHQTPKVKSTLPTPPATSRCELGDIAFLATYDQKLGTPTNSWGNAVLMQAKEHFRPGCSRVQEDLYETSTEFEYTSPRPLTGQKRDLSQAKGCLYYWDFDDHYFWHHRAPHRFSCKSTGAILARPKPASGIHYQDAFERMLTDLFCGIAGRGFLLSPPSNSQCWSQIIHDLIQNAATRAVAHKRIFSSRTKPPSRLYNFVALAQSEQHAPSYIRCSLAEFYGNLTDNENIKKQVSQLEKEASEFSPDELEHQKEAGQKTNDSPPPPLNRGKTDDEDSGGGSFIVFQFKSLKE